MLKQLPHKLRYTFVGSLVLNGVFVLWLLVSIFAPWYIETTGALDYAEIYAFNQKFCVQDYQRMLDRIVNSMAMIQSERPAWKQLCHKCLPAKLQNRWKIRFATIDRSSSIRTMVELPTQIGYGVVDRNPDSATQIIHTLDR